MIKDCSHEFDLILSNRAKARATVRLIQYAAEDAGELGLKDCRHLLHFAAGLIRVRYGLQDIDGTSTASGGQHSDGSEYDSLPQDVAS